jgi:hypothetical protein
MLCSLSTRRRLLRRGNLGACKPRFFRRLRAREVIRCEMRGSPVFGSIFYFLCCAVPQAGA